MKKYLLLFSLAAFFAIIFVACEDSTGPDPVTDVGTLIIQSNPAGATVFIDNVSKGTTNDTIPNVAVGTRTIRLELDNYRDTTFTVSIVKDQSTLKVVTLTSSVIPPDVTKYGPIKVWETTGTGSSEPSGLDLSAGVAVSSNSADADIYYLTNAAFTVHELRGASFFISSNSNLNDTLDSPLATSSWADMVSDGTSNYFFIYDDNGHYSKAKIVDISPSNEIPAWVRIEWYYNETQNDPRF